MFGRLPDVPGDEVAVTIDGRPFVARSYDSVASALFAAGTRTFGIRAREADACAPYCMMGVCFECLVTIDGRRNQQACLVPVAPGMTIETASGRDAPDGR